MADRIDRADQLSSIHEQIEPAPQKDFSYRYDKAGNRIAETEKGETAESQFNILNQLTTTTKESNQPRSYSWDAANQLVKITAGTHRTEFSYDGYGRRYRVMEFENNTLTSHKILVWCGLSLCQERTAENKITKSFFGMGFIQDGAPYTYTVDHLGSIREVTDQSGQLVSRYDYSPWGQRTLLNGTERADFGFTGHYYHPPSTLLLAPYRAYDPTIGRWLSRDPIREAGGVNLYQYGGNDPISRTDPFGLIDVLVFIWNWQKLGPIYGRVGHVMVTDSDKNALLSQFPHDPGERSVSHGKNRRLDFAQTVSEEGGDETWQFRVHLPNDEDFQKSLQDQLGKKYWYAFPNPDKNETHCARAAYEALKAGGLPLAGHSYSEDSTLYPDTLATLLSNLAAQKNDTNAPWKVEKVR